MTEAERYVPAAGRMWLTGSYDAALALTMRQAHWRPLLVDAATAGLGEGGTMLDVGAGTGAVALALAARRPDARVIALDGDDAVLDRAREKPGAATVEWSRGLVTALPLPDASVDRATCSLLLHHLGTDAKGAALAEIRRVLLPGGLLFVADWGAPATRATSAGFRLLEVLDGKVTTADHRAGRLPALIAQAGFADVQVTRRLNTFWGTLELLAARPA